MSFKKFSYVVFIVIFALSLVTACQPQDGQQEAESTDLPELSEQAGTAEEDTLGKMPSGDLVIATWGGTYQELLQKYVEPIVKETAPDINIIYQTGQDYETIAKAMLEKGSESTFDIMMIGQLDIAKMTENDLVQKLDESKIPNLKNINPTFRDDYFMPQIFSAGVLAYNKNQVSPVPDSCPDHNFNLSPTNHQSNYRKD